MQKISEHKYLWNIALGCFVLAGLTGFLYRLGFLGWMPQGLSLDNIRHAHSHLMFFGWAVPMPFYIILRKISGIQVEESSGQRWMEIATGVTLVFGLLSYPFFLLYGYRPVAVGSATMPLSVVFSGLVMIGWYGFMWGYWKSREALKGSQSLPWFDGALILLAVCSLGAWGVAVIQEINPEAHLLMKSMTHFFLATFTEGWVVLVLLGILIAEIRPPREKWPVSPQIALGAIAIGAPLTFPYGISETLLTPMLLGTARFGGGLAAVGLLMAMIAVVRSGKWRHPVWIWPIALLILKGIMQLGASVVPSSFWLSDPGLRILYLHILLLGGLTLLSLGWLHHYSGVCDAYFQTVGGAVLITFITLVLPTSLWPELFSGSWMIYALAAGALLPVLATSVHWLQLIKS